MKKFTGQNTLTFTSPQYPICPCRRSCFFTCIKYICIQIVLISWRKSNITLLIILYKKKTIVKRKCSTKTFKIIVQTPMYVLSIFINATQKKEYFRQFTTSTKQISHLPCIRLFTIRNIITRWNKMLNGNTSKSACSNRDYVSFYCYCK